MMKGLSKVSLDEVAAGGYALDDVTDAMITLWHRSGGTAILDRAEPIAVLIFTPVPDKILSTSFMATEAFFGSNWKPTLYLRRYLDRKMDKLPGVSLMSFTYSTHPEVARWYRFMGYGAPLTEDKRNTFTRSPSNRSAV
ncbi:hypothetical protein [Mesorhizobium sp. LNHC252B00]|uniref:hypothetical protein n=1 Tax=Mesorhizobium sp. LNHC252B00 TaxID=1287252 RepID=UPI0012EC2A2D|nr:hypothetical protein [Mesorhizobium sp. LNHC252B00]